MNQYLLDTNILSHLIRQPQGNVARRIAEIGETHIFTSIIVAAELRYGVARKGSERLRNQVEAVLGVMHVLPLQTPAEDHYAALRVHLEAAGTPIGATDMLIAAQALVLGQVLVTDNEREFARVPALMVENWIREQDHA